MSLPELSPLIADTLVCRDCGETIKPKPVMIKRGQKPFCSHIEYIHKNEKTGCNYRVESTTMTSMQMVPLRSDGSEARP